MPPCKHASQKLNKPMNTLTQSADKPARRIWHRPTPLAVLAVLAAFGLMTYLGIWQLQRLVWKEALITRIAHYASAAPLEALPPAEELKALGFARARVRGQYLHDKELYLAGRYYRSKFGYHLLTPMKLDDGRVLLVNRGWVPEEKRLPDSRLESLVSYPLNLTVMLRTDYDKPRFAPKSSPGSAIWYWRDIEGMRAATGLDLLPVSADALYLANPGGFPVTGDGVIHLRNDHFGYAMTWFMIAISALVVFFFFHWRVEDKVTN